MTWNYRENNFFHNDICNPNYFGFIIRLSII